MDKNANSSGQGRHSFAFEGGEDLTTMGATWFVSYCYYDKIDRTHRNWERVETHNSRQSVYRRTDHYHRFWLERVLEMDSERLSANTIGLTGDEVIKMAQALLKTIKTEPKAEKPMTDSDFQKILQNIDTVLKGKSLTAAQTLNLIKRFFENIDINDKL